MTAGFTRPRPTLVRGPGFSVEELGRTGLRYVEGERVMLVDSEGLAVPSRIAVYRGSITAWQPPFAADPVGREDVTRIIDNIVNALGFCGYKIEVI